MFLKKITLTNFKTYNKLEFNCNNKFNIIIGENNIGKSTLYDALLLWNLAYSKLIKKDKIGFYKKTNYNSMKINFSKFSIFRLLNSSDLFTYTELSAKIELTIKDSEANEYNLEIELNTPDIQNSYIRFTNIHKLDDFNRFADYCNDKNIKLLDAIKIRLTKPISSLLKQEPFLNKAQIRKKTYLGFSQEALRNKVLATIEDRKFEYLKTKLQNILGATYTIRFKNDNREDDEFISMTIQRGAEKEIDLLLVGSGVLHILEIFSTVKSEQNNIDNVNLLLLDEPDSHIHADIQSRLIDELKSEENLQTFLITHNDRLMQKANDGELFYICQDTKDTEVLNSLSLDDYEVVSQGLSNLFDIENEKPILLTEGKTDKKLIEMAWRKLHPAIEIPYNVISPGTDTINHDDMTASAEGVKKTLEYASTFIDKKIIGIFDNDSEGRRQYKGLKVSIFEPYVADDNVRKHLTKDIWGLCLPVPDFRSSFVTVDSIQDSHFVIEHYFTNEVLTEFNVKGNNILMSDVFRIQGNKNTFSTNINAKPMHAFSHFEVLFSKLNELLEINI